MQHVKIMLNRRSVSNPSHFSSHNKEQQCFQSAKISVKHLNLG